MKIRFHDGKSRAKSFSVLKFGEREAFRLAVAARSDLVAEVENRSFLHHPVAMRVSGQRLDSTRPNMAESGFRRSLSGECSGKKIIAREGKVNWARPSRPKSAR